jgi:hypothetical protein
MFNCSKDAAQRTGVEILINDEVVNTNVYFIANLFAKAQSIGKSADEVLSGLIQSNLANNAPMEKLAGNGAVEDTLIINGDSYTFDPWVITSLRAESYIRDEALDFVLNERLVRACDRFLLGEAMAIPG